MSKSMMAKIVLAAVVSFGLTLSAVHAGTISRVSPSTNGFSTQTTGAFSGSQLSLSGNAVFATPPTFGLPAASGLAPVSGGPGPVTIQPVPQAPPGAVPDSGSAVVLLMLALLGLAAIRLRLTRA